MGSARITFQATANGMVRSTTAAHYWERAGVCVCDRERYILCAPKVCRCLLGELENGTERKTLVKMHQVPLTILLGFSLFYCLRIYQRTFKHIVHILLCEPCIAMCVVYIKALYMHPHFLYILSTCT